MLDVRITVVKLASPAMAPTGIMARPAANDGGSAETFPTVLADLIHQWHCEYFAIHGVMAMCICICVTVQDEVGREDRRRSEIKNFLLVKNNRQGHKTTANIRSCKPDSALIEGRDKLDSQDQYHRSSGKSWRGQNIRLATRSGSRKMAIS